MPKSHDAKVKRILAQQALHAEKVANGGLGRREMRRRNDPTLAEKRAARQEAELARQAREAQAAAKAARARAAEEKAAAARLATERIRKTAETRGDDA